MTTQHLRAPMSLVVTIVVVAASLGGCARRDEVADGFPDGACVTFSASDDGDHQRLGKADCAGPHTHVVVAWVGRDTTCPAGSDAAFGTPDGTLCLRADPGPSATP